MKNDYSFPFNSHLNDKKDNVSNDNTTGGASTNTDAVAPWRRIGNPSIGRGFLGPSATAFDVFRLNPLRHHNETVNIYSHLIGAVIFIYYAIWVPTCGPANLENKDIFILELYCAGVASCFILSTIHHASGHVSELVYSRSRQYDILGITLLMGSAGPAMIYFGNFYNETLQQYYFALTGFVWVTCAGIIIASGSKGLSTPARLRVLASLALPGLAAVAHGTILSIMSGSERVLSLRWILWTLGLNVTGALFYVSQFPECYFKGWFDIHGASHQLFHICILGASLTFWRGLMEAVVKIRGA